MVRSLFQADHCLQGRPSPSSLEAATPSSAPSEAGGFGWVIETIVLAAATTATLYVYHDPGLKALFAVDYYSRQGLWSKVLDTARQLRPII